MLNDTRVVLERLCAERAESFAGMTRIIGRNPAYIQQFVRRGVPRKLGEAERRKLARYFSVPESLLGGPAEDEPVAGLVPVKRSNVRASAGPGAIPYDEVAKPYFGFEENWLKGLTSSRPNRLSIIRVDGDSMAPTLNAGDDILIDLNDCGNRVRDGIYVLRADDALVVKRLALHPAGRRVTVQSDNPAYPDWPDCDREELQCVGRVIWAGRKVA